MAIESAYRLKPSNYAIIRWLGCDTFEPDRAVTSHFVSSKTLFWIRLPIVVYATALFWADVIYAACTGEMRHYFVYFTHLTLIGLYAYFTTTFYHHWRYLSSKERHPISFLNQPTVLSYLFDFLYHTLIVYNIVTPAVYWALLSGTLLNDHTATTMDWWLAISVHGVTFVMMMTEVIMNRMCVRVRMVIPVFLLVLIYMLLTFVVYGTDQWWVYSFLDWSQGPSATVWYVAVAIIVVLCFFLQVAIHGLRNKIARVTISKGRQTRTHLVASQINSADGNQDSRLYSQTLVESDMLDSRITLGGSVTCTNANDDKQYYKQPPTLVGSHTTIGTIVEKGV